MIEGLNYETFSALLGESFDLTPPGSEPLQLTLSSCTPSTIGNPESPAFSLLFHGPGDYAVAQQICTLAHPRLGSVDLFIVPLGPDPDGMVYEIIFG